MTAVRKIIALIVIVFFALPMLFGIIWVVGLTRASVSPEFVSDLPREIIAEIPAIAEDIFREAQDERVISDENTRAWFQAAAKAGVTPKKVMSEIGLLDWLENELSDSIAEVGEVLRGERSTRKIGFNLRPLKEILLREDVDIYLIQVLSNLPLCDEEGNRQWLRAVGRDFGHDRLPACQPDLEIAREVLNYERMEAVEDMPEEIEIFEDIHFLPFGISRTVTLFSYFLFIIPVFFIFIGALIAAASHASFFRWSGVSVFLGALPALLIASFAKHFSMMALKFAPYSYTEGWSQEFHELVLENTSWIPMRIIDQLFSPVITVAGIVCVIGIVLFALSFIARGKQETRQAARVQT